MTEHVSAPTYKCYRFPPEIIGHAVWRYFRFAPSYRDAQELLAELGVVPEVRPGSREQAAPPAACAGRLLRPV